MNTATLIQKVELSRLIDKAQSIIKRIHEELGPESCFMVDAEEFESRKNAGDEVSNLVIDSEIVYTLQHFIDNVQKLERQITELEAYKRRTEMTLAHQSRKRCCL